MHVAKMMPPGRATVKCSRALRLVPTRPPESKGSGQPASQAGDTMVAKGSLGTPGLTHLAGSWLGG